MSATLFTIGYQGAKLEQVVASLAAARVSVLVDTRETPMSRRVEFRQRALASALGDAGIRYLSVRALGAPKPLRAIAADDWAGFAAGYRERLAVAREELERLVPLVASERVCLLCFEADPKACHRSLLAHEIQRLLDVSAVHLRPGRADEADDHERLMALGEVAHHQVEVAVGKLALIALLAADRVPVDVESGSFQDFLFGHAQEGPETDVLIDRRPFYERAEAAQSPGRALLRVCLRQACRP